MFFEVQRYGFSLHNPNIYMSFLCYYLKKQIEVFFVGQNVSNFTFISVSYRMISTSGTKCWYSGHMISTSGTEC